MLNSKTYRPTAKWNKTISYEDYKASVDKIRYIELGETYQVNYTFRLQAEFKGMRKAFMPGYVMLNHLPSAPI